MNTRHLDYTPDGQIKSIKDNDKLIATYQYNHLRQRVSKTTYDDKQNIKDTTQYLWDKGLLSAEIKDDKVIRRYVYLDIMPVAVLDYGYDEKGKLNETKVYSVHTDHLGTPKAITNDKQETVWSIEMDTFGETKSIDSKNGFEFNLRFAGQYFDQETGYHYNYHRYYDPKVGRYLTSDPIGLAGGFNSYGYANSEPWGAVDWLGLAAIKVIFPDYKADGYWFTGHSGVVIIDDSTGLTKYYEYGRYQNPLGVVRNISVPDLVMKDGKPTKSSMLELMRSLSKKTGKNGNITASYHKNANNFNGMLEYAMARKNQNSNPDRRPYSVRNNNCDTFADQVIRVGYNKPSGDDENRIVDWPWGAAKTTFAISYDAKKDKLGGTMYWFEE